MIKIENLEVFNLEGAIRGMRFPMQSGEKSDSYYNDVHFGSSSWSEYVIGPNDLVLARKLINAGSDHSKFLRQIVVSIDITAGRHWWAQMDTYKVGTTTNSESTMHRLTSAPITADNFAIQDMMSLSFAPEDERDDGYSWTVFEAWDDILYVLEALRKKYLETKDKRYWRALIELLPQSYLQKRHWTGNYANLLNMAVSREGHKLDEWSMFIKYLTEEAPYFRVFLTAARERK